MTIYKLPEMTVVEKADRPFAVALGNFDGVHIGHSRLLSMVCEITADRGDCASAVWTFVSLPKGGASVLTPLREKLSAFAKAGVEYAVLAEFDSVRDLSPEDFVRDVLLDKLSAVAVVCGFNFRFGKGAAGTAERLSQLLSPAGVSVTVVEPVTVGGEPVSSTRIRRAVSLGEMEEAETLLGRPFFVTLPVVHGQALGRTWGIPTVNQTVPPFLAVPAFGVYASVVLLDGRAFAAVTNIGVRPTVSNEGTVYMETHLLDFDGDLYGEEITVSLSCRLRGEERFPDVESLKHQIALDIEAARAYFSARPDKLRTPRKEGCG